MKIQTTIRKGLLFAGFAAALLMTSPAHAQEITNSEFSDGPYVASLAQPVDTQQTADAATTMPASEAVRASESIAASGEWQQASLIQIPRPVSETLVLTSFGICASLIALYVLAATKRTPRISRAPYVSTPSA
jgi:hypothetical protein